MGVLSHVSRIIVRIKCAGIYRATNMEPSVSWILNKYICCCCDRLNTYVGSKTYARDKEKGSGVESEWKAGIFPHQHFRQATLAG